VRGGIRGVIATIGVLAGLLLAGLGSTAPNLASAASCSPATNVEAIVDDSGSMEFTDPNRLRVQGLDLLIDTLPPATQLGAVEFGSGFEFNIEGVANIPAADTVFAPQPVGANGAAMKAALKTLVKADNGATDYNGAFTHSDADNPTAQARIFLTDGGHDVGEYANGHLTHNVPTYVIGFGAGIADATDQGRLKKIAADTGGSYFPLTDASQLQSVMNTIGASLTCQTPPRSFSDKLAKGQSKVHQVTIGASTKAIQIVLSWASPLDHFKISGFKLINNGKPVAVAARLAHPRKLKIKQNGSTTFTLVKVSGLSKGHLSFKVKATKVGSGEPKVSLTTQVTQGAHH
jgi:hypothetical protein